MKKIQPINIWTNGQIKSAKYMTLLCGTDNLKDSAIFYYALFAETENQEEEKIQGEKLADGNITMTGTSYDNWETNEYAWNWAATTLGITLLPDTNTAPTTNKLP